MGRGRRPGVECTPDALKRLRAAATPRAGLLGPALRDPTRRQIASCGPRPPSDRCCGAGCSAQPAVDGPTGWLDGRCVLIRRLAWDSVDGYDSRYVGTGTHPEPADVDLGDRLARAGWLVVGVPEAEVVVHPIDGQGILDVRGPRAAARACAGTSDDRYRAPARTLMALARRG